MTPLIKPEGNGDLPVFLLKVGIQKTYLFSRNRKFMWFKMTENIQCKTQMQAGSPEVRFFAHTADYSNFSTTSQAS